MERRKALGRRRGTLWRALRSARRTPFGGASLARTLASRRSIGGDFSLRDRDFRDSGGLFWSP